MRSRKPMFGRNMTLLALQKPGAANYFSILRPNTGESFFDMEVRPLCSWGECARTLTCSGPFLWHHMSVVIHCCDTESQ